MQAHSLLKSLQAHQPTDILILYLRRKRLITHFVQFVHPDIMLNEIEPWGFVYLIILPLEPNMPSVDMDWSEFLF